MNGIVGALGFGFLLGLRHALDPDHVVAVTNMATGRKSLWYAGLIGLLWGIGHAGVLLPVGLIWILLGVEVPAAWAQRFEALVGLVLLAMGLWTLRRYRSEQVHAHVHAHDGVTHVHFHSHQGGRDHDHAHDSATTPVRAALPSFFPVLIGMAHGLAGSSAVLLLTLSLVSRREAFPFLMLFSLGSILSMGSLATLLGALIQAANNHLPGVHRHLWAASGVLSCLMGAWLLLTA